MEFFQDPQRHPFMRHALAFNVVSLVTFLLAVFFSIQGPEFSIEFTGGTVLEVNYEQQPKSRRSAGRWMRGLPRLLGPEFGSSRDVLIRMP